MESAILTAGAVAGALAVVGGLCWRYVIKPNLITVFFGAFDTPNFRESVGEVVEARNAAQLRPILDELSFNGGKSMKDVVIRIDARLDDHITFHSKVD